MSLTVKFISFEIDENEEQMVVIRRRFSSSLAAVVDSDARLAKEFR